MKKLTVILIAVFTVFIFTSHTYAQGRASIGLKAGVNVANFYGEDAASSEMTFGFAGGGYIEMPVGGRISIRPEVLYSARGGKMRHSFAGTDLKTKFDMNYLDVPVLAVMTFMDTYQVFAGPMWGFFLEGEANSDSELFGEGESDIDSDEVNSPQTGLMVGAGIRFGSFNLEARYMLGLSQTFENDEQILDSDLKSGLGQVMIVFPF